jgi:hypothetical protein
VLNIHRMGGKSGATIAEEPLVPTLRKERFCDRIKRKLHTHIYARK